MMQKNTKEEFSRYKYSLNKTSRNYNDLEGYEGYEMEKRMTIRGAIFFILSILTSC